MKNEKNMRSVSFLILITFCINANAQIQSDCPPEQTIVAANTNTDYDIILTWTENDITHHLDACDVHVKGNGNFIALATATKSISNAKPDIVLMEVDKNGNPLKTLKLDNGDIDFPKKLFVDEPKNGNDGKITIMGNSAVSGVTQFAFITVEINATTGTWTLNNNKTFYYDNPTNDNIINASKLKSGDYILTGNTSKSGHSDLVFIKASQNGVMKWRSEITLTGTYLDANAHITDDANHAYFAGNVRQHNFFPNPSTSNPIITEYVIVGRINKANGSIDKVALLAADLSKTNNKEYDQGAHDIACKVNGGITSVYVVGSYTNNDKGYVKSACLWRLNFDNFNSTNPSNKFLVRARPHYYQYDINDVSTMLSTSFTKINVTNNTRYTSMMIRDRNSDPWAFVIADLLHGGKTRKDGNGNPVGTYMYRNNAGNMHFGRKSDIIWKSNKLYFTSTFRPYGSAGTSGGDKHKTVIHTQDLTTFSDDPDDCAVDRVVKILHDKEPFYKPRYLVANTDYLTYTCSGSTQNQNCSEENALTFTKSNITLEKEQCLEKYAYNRGWSITFEATDQRTNISDYTPVEGIDVQRIDLSQGGNSGDNPRDPSAAVIAHGNMINLVLCKSESQIFSAKDSYVDHILLLINDRGDVLKRMPLGMSEDYEDHPVEMFVKPNPSSLIAYDIYLVGYSKLVDQINPEDYDFSIYKYTIDYDLNIGTTYAKIIDVNNADQDDILQKADFLENDPTSNYLALINGGILLSGITHNSNQTTDNIHMLYSLSNEDIEWGTRVGNSTINDPKASSSFFTYIDQSSLPTSKISAFVSGSIGVSGGGTYGTHFYVAELDITNGNVVNNGNGEEVLHFNSFNPTAPIRDDEVLIYDIECTESTSGLFGDRLYLVGGQANRGLVGTISLDPTSTNTIFGTKTFKRIENKANVNEVLQVVNWDGHNITTQGTYENAVTSSSGDDLAFFRLGDPIAGYTLVQDARYFGGSGIEKLVNSKVLIDPYTNCAIITGTSESFSGSNPTEAYIVRTFSNLANRCDANCGYDQISTYSVTPFQTHDIEFQTSNQSAIDNTLVSNNLSNGEDDVCESNVAFNGNTGSEPFIESLAIENYNNKPTSIYPNPANNYLTIEFGSLEGAARILSIDGKEMMANMNLVEGENQLDIAELPMGMYVIEIRTTEGCNYSKVHERIV